MSAVFLSASVPVPGRGNYYKNSDPFLIQTAVREFVTAVLGRRLIVWGGHPAITPMVWAICEDLGVSFANAVVLYQSKFFSEVFPEENRRFRNVIYVNAVPGDRNASLSRMRKQMLSRADLSAAVFIGGMKGILDEYRLFSEFHPGLKALAIAAPGGAARELAERSGNVGSADAQGLDFARIFYRQLGVAPDEPRNKVVRTGGPPRTR